MRLKCFYPGCTAHPSKGDTLRRINAKGVPGIWACERHVKNTDAPRDPETERLIKAIERGDEKETPDAAA